jgi:hypothetical protein
MTLIKMLNIFCIKNIDRKFFLLSHFAFNVLFQRVFLSLLLSVRNNFFADMPFPFLSVFLILSYFSCKRNVGVMCETSTLGVTIFCGKVHVVITFYEYTSPFINIFLRVRFIFFSSQGHILLVGFVICIYREAALYEKRVTHSSLLMCIFYSF